MKRTSSKTARVNNSRTRKKSRARLFVVLSALNILLTVLIAVLFPVAFSNDAKTAEKRKSWLGITGITVTGNTRYDNEAIIGVSGLTEGESVFSINKGQITKRLRKSFPYVEKAEIDINFRRGVTVRITEFPELGAVYANGSWMVVNHEGVGLLKMPLRSERPLRKLYLKGAKTIANEVGEQVLSKQSLSIATQLVDAFEDYKLDGIGVIDMSNPNDIRLHWKNQIVILMGNDSNLRYEVAVVASSLPKVVARHGETATGVLNVSLYSDNTVESPTVIFTPSSLLNDRPEQVGSGTAGSTTAAQPLAGAATTTSARNQTTSRNG